LGYFCCGEFSGYFSHWTNAVSYVWLPSGLFLGVLLLTPPRRWLLLILAAGVGDLAFNYLWEPWPLWQMLLAHCGNSASAVVGAALVRRFISKRPTLSSVQELVGVVALGGMLSLPLAALNGAALLIYGHGGTSFRDSFTAWYTSDLLGVILLTPAVLVWSPSRRKLRGSRKPRTVVEFASLMFALCLVTSAAFYFQWLRQTETLYVAFPFTIWAVW